MMKKIFLFSILTILHAGVFAQTAKYLTIDFVPESVPGACDAEVHLNTAALKEPVQVFYNIDHRAGNGKDIYELCSGTTVSIQVMDSNCVKVNLNMYIHPDPDSQVMLDTLVAQLPSTVVATDGTLDFYFSGPAGDINLLQRYSGSASSTFTNGYSFTSLEENDYSFEVMDSVWSGSDLSLVPQFFVGVYFSSVLPNCAHNFDFDVYVVPASPGNCDGSISLVPTVATTADYDFNVFAWGQDGYPQINTDDGFTFYNYAENVCPGPIVVEAYQNFGSNAYSLFNRVYFLGVDSAGTFTWSPPVIPPGVDTFVLSSIQNCQFDYSLPPDTVYVDTIHFIGSNTYAVTLVVEQGGYEILVNGTLVVDTSVAFFIDFTLYCPYDTAVVRDDALVYQSMRSLVYYGDAPIITALPQMEQGLVSVYPNPASNKIFLSGNQPIKNVEVFTVNGKSVYKILPGLRNVEIHLNGWPSGVYVLKYTDEQGMSGVSRFVKL